MQLALEKVHKNDMTSKVKVKIDRDSVECSATTKVKLPSFSNGHFAIGLHSTNPHKTGREFQFGSQL